MLYLIPRSNQITRDAAASNSSLLGNSTIKNLDARSGWVSQPNQRGTIDIIWSCLLVLFVCVWTVLHINIPAKTDSFWTKVLRKARWAFFAICLPEIVMLIASMQWSSARVSVRDMNARGDMNWTVVHAFYANSGGFMLKTRGMRQSFPISAKSIYYLRCENRIELPEITREEIWDRSKADKFAKWVAFLQTIYLVIQCIARATQNLAVTPLEIFTIAFVVCSAITGFFWLNKPQDIEIPTTIHVDWNMCEVCIAAGNSALNPWTNTPMDFVEKSLWGQWERRPSLHSFGSLTKPLDREPDDFGYSPPDLPLAISMWIVSMLYCGIHVSGWNFSFASVAERMLWRVCSLAMLGVTFLGGIIQVISTLPKFDYNLNLFWIWVRKTTETPTTVQKYLFDVPASIGGALYLLARFCLIVEVFYSLHSLPITAYDTVDWTSYLPHV